MSILVVGSVAFDTIATPSGQVKDILGGAATYFSLAASYFTEVRMVAVVGEDFTSQNEAVLKNRGVDTRGIERTKGKTFRWGGQYLDNLNEAKTDFTELNVFEKFQPRIPKEYADSQFLFLANIIWSYFKGAKATENPWHANTLEWTTPSPPPHGNWPGPVPVVFRGPYEYSSPEVAEDFLPQSQLLEHSTAAAD